MSFRIAVVVGSLRRESFNRQLAGALARLAPRDLEFVQVRVADLPLYNQDDDGKQAPSVLRFKGELTAAQGVLFVTPEYNRSIPGVLKNAIDVASRPYGKSSFLGKPIGIIGSAPGQLGAVSAAKHLQNILPGIAGPILGTEAFLNGVGDAFDDKGELIKEALQKVLQQYIDAFAAFVEKQNG